MRTGEGQVGRSMGPRSELCGCLGGGLMNGEKSMDSDGDLEKKGERACSVEIHRRGKLLMMTIDDGNGR